MSQARYEGVDPVTEAALSATVADIEQQTVCPLRFHDDMDSLRQVMAAQLFDDIGECLARKGQATLIVPVGPVGQYELLAERCRNEGISLANVTLIVMDEYLTADNRWIPDTDPLSFRGHIERNLTSKLPAGTQPEIVVPDPLAPHRVGDVIARRGLDYTYAGVGITGHLAFNDPVPGRDDPDWFSGLPTRVVALSAETRLINSVTAAKGNTLLVPLSAVTVGMREILAADRIRIWMNRSWQCAAVRRILFGPVTGAFPASLVRRHPDWTLDITRDVTQMPEPALR